MFCTSKRGQRIIRQSLGYKVVNASISGETTLGVKTRLNKLLNDNQPELVIVELGGNDGLRGFALTEIEKNLLDIVKMIKLSGIEILLVPIQLPPNYGAAYNQRFMSIYNVVSDTMEVDLSEFILHNIAQRPELMQTDGIHPVQTAQSIMLDNIWPSLQPLLIK
ncbi:MAG: arylesterase [Proteobacteria bacterium]|nr:arylesterase [Pseudomonadota bacterium]